MRLLSQGRYQAGSWEIERRVVYKAEVMEEGTNTRFVVTNKADEPEDLYDHYTERGETENRIKDLKVALKADPLRRKLVDEGIERMQLDTLRLRLVKIGGRVRELVTKVRVHLASGQYFWHALSSAFEGVHE